MSFISAFTKLKADKTWSDNEFQELKTADPLGFMYEAKKIKSQQEALTDPKKYIEARNLAINTAMVEIYEHWGKKVKALLDAGNPEPQARRKADAVAQGMWASALVEIDEDYPLDSMSTAVQGQRSTNQLAHELNNMKLKLSKKHAVKRTKTSKK